ncbi:MAG TPA: hypothetical protein VFS43_30485 [Polyangiaceae bacterium]|nr:hypothetical protein [Polyangiaceae bacterium]
MRAAARARLAAVGLLASLGSPPAQAAPMGAGTESIMVMALEADLVNDHLAKTLTNALRQQVLDAPEYTLGGMSPSLIVRAAEVKCQLKGLGRPLTPGSDLAFDGPCLKRIAGTMRAKRYLWGYIFNEGSRPTVRLHLWQEGEPDRSVTLPYDGRPREQMAERLYRKLLTPEKVGDVKVVSDATFEGELVIDDVTQGPFVPGFEVTLLGGDHVFEVRRRGKPLAHAKAQVVPGRWAEVALARVVEPAPALPPPPAASVVFVSPRSSPWPWVLGGAGVAGLAGAGLFFGLRQGERGDLAQACGGRACPPGQQSTVDRADLYGTLSAVSLGVGLAAGAGLVTYALLPKRAPAPSVGVIPVTGGALTSVGGRF